MEEKELDHILATMTLGDEDEANMDITLPVEESPHVLNFHADGDDPYEQEDVLIDDPDDLE